MLGHCLTRTVASVPGLGAPGAARRVLELLNEAASEEDPASGQAVSSPEGPFIEVGVDPDIGGAIAILRGDQAPKQPSDFAALTVEILDAPILKVEQKVLTKRTNRTMRCAGAMFDLSPCAALRLRGPFMPTCPAPSAHWSQTECCMSCFCKYACNNGAATACPSPWALTCTLTLHT